MKNVRELIRKPVGRFAILYVALFLLSILASFVNFRILDREKIYQRLGSQINSELDAIETIYHIGGSDAVVGHVQSRITENSEKLSNLEEAHYYSWRNATGNNEVSSIPYWTEANITRTYQDFLVLDDLPRLYAGNILSDEYRRWFTNPDYDLILKQRTLTDGSSIVVAQDLNFVQDMRFANQILLAIVLTLFLSGGVIGVRMIVSTYCRIDTILIACKNIITTGNLSERIEATPKAKDPERLIDVLNDMLSRIEKSFLSLQLSTANIAHDLKTPLARLRAKVEGLEEGRSDSDRNRIGEILREAERMQRVFDASIQIAMLESGKPLSKMEPVRVDTLLRKLIEFYDPVFETRDFHIDTNVEPITIEGDQQLLEQMLSNILENASKYVPQGGRIQIRTSNGKHRQSILISDNGPGIDRAHRDRVFEKFFRLDSSRSTEGNGLGLSIVKAIATAHNGSVRLTDHDPGLVVEIEF